LKLCVSNFKIPSVFVPYTSYQYYTAVTSKQLYFYTYSYFVAVSYMVRKHLTGFVMLTHSVMNEDRNVGISTSVGQLVWNTPVLCPNG